MSRQILFLQGAAEGAYTADMELVRNLQGKLGPNYTIIFPPMPNEANPSYYEWKPKIEEEIMKVQEPLVLVAHSVGASILLKYLSEATLTGKLAGIFLIATPFWGGNGWRYEGYEKLELPKSLESKLPPATPIFLYHCKDDTVVPFDHLALYAALLPHATERPLKRGGHMFNNDLSIAAQDIRGLKLAK